MTVTREPKPHPAHRVSGIIYDPETRRARIAGTGLEVWEIINGYRSVDYVWRRLEEAFHWLTPHQLKAAVTFANLNPDFVAAEIAENDAVEDGFFGREPVWPDLPETYDIPS
jgi:uncharacterized protein (DUF433 family)